MTKRSTGGTTKARASKLSTAKLRQGTQELLERRGMAAAATGRRRGFGPALHTPAAGAVPAPAAYGTYAALAGEPAFSHGGRRAPEQRALTGALPAHAELKGHRHRGAEKHSAH
ncbi:hypothetical protein ACIGXM_16930 [Kitasatospora sp. NPDC052896]|uniref:hypothetical protein n=1 Tax=Kitasatospora sp. NPDC052896 TaxID=3364061 RepID=UPI0037CAC6B8